MSNEERPFKYATHEWGRKARKDNEFKRRTAMKNDTEEQVIELSKTNLAADGMTIVEDPAEEPGDDDESITIDVLAAVEEQRLEINRLKSQIRQLRQEVKRWRSKYKVAYRDWWEDWLKRRKQDLPAQEALARIEREWQEQQNAE